MHRALWSALALGGLCACESPTRPAETPAATLSSVTDGNFRFRLTDLGKLGGSFSVAFGVNERSEAVGFSELPSGEVRAFLWRPASGMRSLGTLGGTFSYADDINDLGEVVGGANLRGDSVGHAFLWAPGRGMQDLGVFPNSPPHFGSEAHAINNRREVVGIAETASGQDKAFIRRPGGRLHSLGTLGGPFSNANGINDATQVVGSSLTRSGEEHAFLWTEDGGMRDLGTLGGSFSIALGISQNGAVTGFSALAPGSDDFEAFLWTKKHGMRRLGSLGKPRSIGDAINTHLRVSGVADTSLPETSYPSLWTPERGMQRLPTLIGFRGDGFGEAWSINEFGVMAGISRDTRETVSATLWTPAAGPLVMEPEPAAALSAEPQKIPAAYRAALCRVETRRAPSWSHLRMMRAKECVR
jgi:probable HAF family extracellular repeat protein